MRLQNLIARNICIYRPKRLIGIAKNDEYNCYFPEYELGELRATLFGIPVPVLWAFERLLVSK